MHPELNIECFDQLREYLRVADRIAADEPVHFAALSGGVSNRTVLVRPSAGPPFVVKQALARLRVATEWISDPGRIRREALGLKWLERLLPPGVITPFLFEDEQHHLLAMQAVPEPHENWKNLLLAGQVVLEHVQQFAKVLAGIHSSSRGRVDLARDFADRSFFESLRLAPYYEYTAGQVPRAAAFLRGLIEETRHQRLALVHGDFSPKNVLVWQGRLILLDHEVIHYGDPAFDLGFSLTHLLSKAHHVPGHRERFLTAALEFWRTYRERAGELAALPGLEARAVRHALGCLLARVDGRSPLEYLTGSERERQRVAVVALISEQPETLPELVERFSAALNS